MVDFQFFQSHRNSLNMLVLKNCTCTRMHCRYKTLLSRLYCFATNGVEEVSNKVGHVNTIKIYVLFAAVLHACMSLDSTHVFIANTLVEFVYKTFSDESDCEVATPFNPSCPLFWIHLRDLTKRSLMTGEVCFRRQIIGWFIFSGGNGTFVVELLATTEPDMTAGGAWVAFLPWSNVLRLTSCPKIASKF